VADIGTIQASSTQEGLVVATTPLIANSLLQADATGAGVVPCEVTSADGSIVVTTTSGSIDLVVEATAASGLTDVYSPVKFSNVTIPSDIVLNVPYISGSGSSRNNPLSATQTIASGSVTCSYGESDGSVVQCDVSINYHTVNTSQLGAQFCLYVSTLGDSAPVFPCVMSQQGACSANSYDNSSNCFLSFQVPSVKGQEITYTVGATYLNGTTVTVEAS